MDPDGYGVDRAPERDRDLRVGESFPRGQPQDFGIGRSESGQGGRDGFLQFGRRSSPVDVFGRRHPLLTHLGDEPIFAGLGPPAVGHDPSGYTDQPRQAFNAVGHVLKSPPCDHVDLGDDIFGDFPVVQTAQDVGKQRTVGCCEQRPEPSLVVPVLLVRTA